MTFSDQGTDVKTSATGETLSSGNLTILIYNVSSGGTALFNQTILENETSNVTAPINVTEEVVEEGYSSPITGEVVGTNDQDSIITKLIGFKGGLFN